MPKLQIKTFTVNPLQENCYVVSVENGDCLVIDNGCWFPEEIAGLTDYIKQANLTPIAQLLTHAHFDHIWGVGALYKEFGTKVWIPEADFKLYEQIEVQAKSLLGISDTPKMAPIERFLTENDTLKLGDVEIRTIATPGHTLGGMCYYAENEGVLFSGDSLFRGSIGRTDLPNGSFENLVEALVDKILTLPESVQVYPGHGPTTTIAYELQNNPFL